MLLDLRYLIECVTSPVWAWTARSVDGLLRSLGLAELPARRIEFPFEVAPMAGVPRAELLEAQFALLYASAQQSTTDESGDLVVLSVEK